MTPKIQWLTIPVFDPGHAILRDGETPHYSKRKAVRGESDDHLAPNYQLSEPLFHVITETDVSSGATRPKKAPSKRRN